MKQKLLYFLFLSFPPLISMAQVGDTVKTFTLGEVVVTGRTIDSTNVISADKMSTYNRLDAGRALNVLPGISLSNVGARNESMVYVRGFDLRQIPVFIDGVPVYVPYDGYVDLGRFTTFDLAEINVSKGFSSSMYGANTLGGAINLVSRMPTDKFEFQGVSGIMPGGFRTSLNLGARWEKFFVQAGISKLKRDYYKMSHDFDSVQNEDGGKRDNSNRDDFKYNVKVGFTPSKNHTYTLSYINQQGEKGTPVYAGSDSRNSLLTRPRFWQWPKWNKESYYFLSNHSFHDNLMTLKARVYYDKFINSLYSYDDVTYTTQTRPYAFQSFYDDYSYGGSVEYETKSIAKNDLKVSAHYKRDVHREHNLNEPVRRFEDHTLSIGLEDTYRPLPNFVIIPGINYNRRQSILAENFDGTEISEFDVNGSDAFNLQLGTLYTISGKHIINASIARKTRFATVKDRYSYRMGTAIPNPDLKAESAINYEVGYSSAFSDKIKVQGNLFYNDLKDAILMVDNVDGDLSQLLNSGEAVFKGVELSIDTRISKLVNAGANYTYIEQNNETNPELKFTNVPNHKVFAFLQINPFRQSYININAEYNSDRYSTSYGVKAGEYLLFNVKSYVHVWKYFSIEGGLNNIFDKNYSLSEGYPEEGRNYFVNVVYSGVFR